MNASEFLVYILTIIFCTVASKLYSLLKEIFGSTPIEEESNNQHRNHSDIKNNAVSNVDSDKEKNNIGN